MERIGNTQSSLKNRNSISGNLQISGDQDMRGHNLMGISLISLNLCLAEEQAEADR